MCPRFCEGEEATPVHQPWQGEGEGNFGRERDEGVRRDEEDLVEGRREEEYVGGNGVQ